MKNIQSIYFFILITMINAPLYTEENTQSETETTNNLEQRKQAIKDYIQQELANNTPYDTIYQKLKDLELDTPEKKTYDSLSTKESKYAEKMRDYSCLSHAQWELITGIVRKHYGQNLYKSKRLT